MLPIDELAPRAARQIVAAHLAHHPALNDLLLGTSELATNAVRHVDRSKAQHLTLTVSVGSGTTRVAVSHRGDVFQPPAGAPSGHVNPSGRGLAIVAAVSHRWGIEQDEQMTVWFEIDGD